MTTAHHAAETEADPIPALIAKAFSAGQHWWPHEEFVELDKLLREEVERLIPLVRLKSEDHPERSREWYACVNAVDAAEYALSFQMGYGPISGSIHVAELARRVNQLRDAAGDQP